MKVIDLHCDLLSYLAVHPNRSIDDPESLCSTPQRKAGRVEHQVLAIFSETGAHSLESGLKQLDIFHSLNSKQFLLAFENASSFCTEQEPIDTVLQRLDWIYTKTPPLYISLTWNGENRFGGGSGSTKGLKEDGKTLLTFLSEKKHTAIDLSHTSDPLARDIIHYIDAQSLTLPILASHSNFRSVQNHIRNLPDDIAKEIIQRKGIIGLVFYNQFLSSPAQLIDHITHGYTLGGKHSLCFGADFFYKEDFTNKLAASGGFFDEMSDASKYPSILQNLPLSDTQKWDIACKNAKAFLSRAQMQPYF